MLWREMTAKPTYTELVYEDSIGVFGSQRADTQRYIAPTSQDTPIS